MVSKASEAPLRLMSIGIDIGKTSFTSSGLIQRQDRLRRKFRRLSLENEFERLPRCIVGMEACLSAHIREPTTASARVRAEDHSGDLRPNRS